MVSKYRNEPIYNKKLCFMCELEFCRNPPSSALFSCRNSKVLSSAQLAEKCQLCLSVKADGSEILL